MIFLAVAAVFDGDGDDDDCIITITRAFARAILDAEFESAIWDDPDALTEEQRENIEGAIASVTEALNA